MDEDQGEHSQERVEDEMETLDVRDRVHEESSVYSSPELIVC